MPSGAPPVFAFENPEAHAGTPCKIKVPSEVLVELRQIVTEEVGPRETHLEFVSSEFSDVASDVWREIGSPLITTHSAWDVFVAMEVVMRTAHN